MTSTVAEDLTTLLVIVCIVYLLFSRPHHSAVGAQYIRARALFGMEDTPT